MLTFVNDDRSNHNYFDEEITGLFNKLQRCHIFKQTNSINEITQIFTCMSFIVIDTPHYRFLYSLMLF